MSHGGGGGGGHESEMAVMEHAQNAAKESSKIINGLIGLFILGFLQGILQHNPVAPTE